MTRRKLSALGYQLADDFDPTDETMFRNMVVWLEDQQIRHYKVEERDKLRNIQSSEWPDTFSQYLKDLGVSGSNLKPAEVADRLLSVAVRLEYSDNVEKYANASSTNVAKQKQEAPKMIAANPLDNIDFSSPEFIEGVNTLAKRLQVTPHENHLVTLEAIAKLVKSRYSKEAISQGKNRLQKGTPFPFEEIDTDTRYQGSPGFSQAAKILRLLFIHDLRDLQTKINECIVALQTVTANPKTDTRLGKVGY